MWYRFENRSLKGKWGGSDRNGEDENYHCYRGVISRVYPSNTIDRTLRRMVDNSTHNIKPNSDSNYILE